MRLMQPSSNIQLSQKSPDLFLKCACKIIRKGCGQHSVFKTDLLVAESLRQGKSPEDASGCVETGIFGKEDSMVGAIPDGRKAGELLSEGISPVQGADRKGPTAVIKSAAKMDQLKTGVPF